MVEDKTEPLDRIFRALADPTRRALLECLAGGERSIGELAAPFDMSLEAVSKHIRVLERAGLVRRQVHGRMHVCHLDARPMHGGLEWIRHYEKFWNRRLDALDDLLQADRTAEKPPKSRNQQRSKR